MPKWGSLFVRYKRQGDPLKSADGARFWHIHEDRPRVIGDGTLQHLRVVARDVADAQWLPGERQISFATDTVVAIIRADGTKSAALWSGSPELGVAPGLLR